MDSTLRLARFIAESGHDAVPEPVRDEAVRALVNWLGCALGGCLDPALDSALDALGIAAGPPAATLIGRGDRLDMLTAALIGGIGSSILDYDDVHLATMIHPSVPVACALFPLAEYRAATGAQVVHAFILGVEAACRAGLALGAAHHERGWHVSGTCGVIGAAAGCAKLLGLDVERTAGAIGIAATAACGLAEMIGSPARSLNLGFAARNGLMAALLAEQGFTSSIRALEAPRGFLAVLGVGVHPEALLDGLGTTWMLNGNTYKPYPCSIALHPIVDACLLLRLKHGLKPRGIKSVDLRVHPAALQLAVRRDPENALEAKLSAHHAAAVALLDGAAGVRQFQEQRVRNKRVSELRARVEAIADPGLAREEAHATITLQDGRVLERHVRRALGSLERPMGDADLSAKFRELATELLATDQAERMLALTWNIAALGDVGALVRASVPQEELEPADLPGSPLIPR